MAETSTTPSYLRRLIAETFGTFLLDAHGVVIYRRSGAVPLMSFDEREVLDRLTAAGR